MTFKKLLKEPLLHFLIAGALLFVVFSFVNDDEGEKTIVINEYDLAEITSKWELTWNRPPTLEELKASLDDYIKEEIYYREALLLNLDHNDAIIRRRMAQKMKFLAEGIATMQEPSEEDLLEYLKDNQANYRTSAVYSFEHRFYSPDNRDDPQNDAQNALAKGDFRTSDKLSLALQIEEQSLDQIRRNFGTTFAVNLSKLEVSNDWQGPIESGFGYHLVKVTSKEASREQTLEEVREQLITSYKYDMREALNQQVLSALLDEYEVIIDLDTTGLDDFELSK